MTSFGHVHQLMNEIGPLLKLDAVSEFEEEQSWALFVDEELAITVDSDFDSGKLILSAELPSVEEDQRSATYEKLLLYNYQWPETDGLRMALEEPGGPIHLLYDLPVDELSIQKLEIVLRNFVEQANAWSEILEIGLGDAEGESPTDSAADGGIRV